MNYLTINKKIGIFTPSMPIGAYYPIRFDRAIQFLKSKGFEVVLGNLSKSQDFYRSGTPQERAQEFNELIYNNEIDCILATIGGMNTNAILPYIDYEYLKSNPKLIVGYSDVAALLSAIYAKTGIHTVYGPTLMSAFGEIGALAEVSFIYFKKLFLEDRILPHTIPMPRGYNDTLVDWETQVEEKPIFKNDWEMIRSGSVIGRCLIFNLGTYAYTFGSEYFPEIKQGDILVLEDTMDNPMQVERAYAHFQISGIFEKIGGLIIGKHAQYDDLHSKRLPKNLVVQFIQRNIPILADVDIGHTLPVMSMINGSKIHLDADAKTITILEY